MSISEKSGYVTFFTLSCPNSMQKIIQIGQTVVEILNFEESCNLIGRELFWPITRQIMDLEVHVIWNANRKPCFADNLSIKSALCGLLLSRYARFDPIWASFCLKYAECEYFWKIGLCHLCSLIVPWLHAKNRKILMTGSVPICSGYVYGKSTESLRKTDPPGRMDFSKFWPNGWF